MSEESKVTTHISTLTILKIILVALLLWALYLIRDILLMLVVAMVIASSMDPMVDWLYRKTRFPRGLSVILVYLIFIALAVTVVYFLVPPMITQFNQLVDRIEDFRNDVASKTTSLSLVLNQLGVTEGLSRIGESFSGFLNNILQTSADVLGGFFRLVAVLVFTFYLISSENGMKNFIKSLTPFKYHAYAMRLTEQIQKKIGYWLLGQLILSGFIFVLTFVGLTILGVKYALALALLAGLLEIVPYLGPVLSAVPAVFVALVQSPPLALFVVLLYVLIQQTENYVLVPKVMGRSVGANPLIILLAVLIGFKIAGIIGMLMAVPIVSAVGVFISDLREHKA